MSKVSTRIAFGAMGVAAASALYFWLGFGAVGSRPSNLQPLAAAKIAVAYAELPKQTFDLPERGLKLQPLFVGYAQTQPDTSGSGEKIVAALDRLKQGKPDTTAHPAPPAELDLSGLPGHCFPKSPKLSDVQKAELARLRWGPTKDLQYRGDGDDATVRLLAAPMLIAPLDPRDPKSEPAVQLARRFVASSRELFLLRDPESELRLLRDEDDGLGGRVVRFQQTYSGLEVWPAQLTANVSEHGYLRSVTGAYVPSPVMLELTSQITPADALARAARQIGAASPADVEVHSAPKLKIYAEKPHEPALSFELILAANGRHQRIFVDARSGEVLAAISEICEAAATGSGTDVLGQTKPLNVYASGSPTRYFLYDTSKPMFVGTPLDAAAKGYVEIRSAALVGSPRLASDSLNAGYDPEGVSAAYNLSEVYDFYLTQFGRNSWDGSGASILAFVRVPDENGSPLDNAYWYNRFMVFGAGDRWAASSDAVAHEMTHAVVQTTASLIYSGQSGAINESMADVLGESHERWLFGANDWRFGSQLRNGAIAGAHRSLSEPQIGIPKQPGKMSEFVVTDQDNGGVHINSGIPNRAFYLLAEGLPTGGVGLTAARNIFWRTLTTKLNSNSDLHDLRAGCVQSAIELFGAGSTQALKVQEAFNAVELFEQAQPPVPSNLTPASGPDSGLYVYQPPGANYFLYRNEAAQGDGSSLRLLSPYAAATDTRATVTADGAVAAHVTAARNLVVVATNASSTANAQLVDLGGTLNSLAISADGSRFALTFRNATTGLLGSSFSLLNLNTGTSEIISPVIPVGDGSSSVSIGVIDEVDISPDGRFALVDAYASNQLADGTMIQGWTIFAIDLSTRAVFAISPPLQGKSIGNPSFARTYSGRFTFEVSGGGTDILAVDLGQSKAAVVRSFSLTQDYKAYPRYSAADNFITYSDDFFSLPDLADRPRVSLISLQSDRVTPIGSPTVLLNYAQSGLSYRRGAFAGAPTLTIAAQQPSVTGGSTGSFRIARPTGDQAISVGVSFRAIGSAVPSVDYRVFNLSATIPANQSYVDVPFTALIRPGSANKMLTLSLDPLLHYAVSSSARSASITLVAPAWSYAYWQSTFVPTIGAITADDDGDGLNNLIEYALGTDPSASSTAITSSNYLTIEKATAGGLVFAQLRLRRTLVREGITFTLQRSSDNSAWIDAGTAVVTDSASELVLRDSLAVQFSQARYFRLRVAETSTGAAVNSRTCFWAGFILNGLSQTYDRQVKTVTVTTIPANVNHSVTYDGSATGPTNAGSYGVVARAAGYSNLIGENSGTLVVDRAPQTIDFPPPADRGFTTATQTLSATATSNLPVGFVLITGPATLTGAQLSLTGAGSVTVLASQPGNANYLAAPEVQRSFRVLTNYDAWRYGVFLNAFGDESVSGPSVTLGADGLSNLLRYALGLSIGPVDPAALPAIRVDDTRWIYTYARPADRPDLAYSVEFSTDLSSSTAWTPVGTHTRVSNSNGMETWEASAPLSAGRAVFFRLKVVRP
jgi:Zn-dependent metalloprotease